MISVLDVIQGIEEMGDCGCSVFFLCVDEWCVIMRWHFLVSFFVPNEEEKGITVPPPALMMALHMVCTTVGQSICDDECIDACMKKTHVMVPRGGLCDGFILKRAHTRP